MSSLRFVTGLMTTEERLLCAGWSEGLMYVQFPDGHICRSGPSQNAQIDSYFYKHEL
jgi:hypothetical protein